MAVSLPKSRVVFFSRFPPDPEGAHGGCHRSYQIWWDLVQTLGVENVHVISYAKLRPRGLRRWSIRALMVRQNPLSVVASSQVAWELASSERHSDPLKQYEAYLRTHGAPRLCVVEDAVWFHGIILANRRLGVPTWACPQNLESLDLEGALPLGHRLRTLSRLGNLANELRSLAACRVRFAISLVEAGFLGGVGLDTELYPYCPVGEVRDFFLKIRAARANGAVEQGLVVLLGSATHVPTREGMQWFVEQIRAHGLPPKARVEFVGLGTDKLAGLEAIGPHGKARGQVSSEALATLLSQAHVVVIAHFSGFGALTRLAELPLAGIPVLAAAHATRAVEACPGVERLPRQWRRWATTLEDLLDRAPGPSAEPAVDRLGYRWD